MSLNITDNKILKPPPSVKQKTPPKSICKIFFLNNAIEKINLYRIFHDPLVKATILLPL